jgi:hypothetical protein
MKNMLIYAKIIVDYSKTLFNHGKKTHQEYKQSQRYKTKITTNKITCFP